MLQPLNLGKKRHGKLSLTKSSKKILADNHELLRQILLAFTGKFNWACYDGYGDNQVGRFGAGFSLILLSKYGHKPRPDSFYAEKYFKAFPQLLETVKPTYDSLENYAAKCYSLRTFNRFLDYFGLITIDGGNIALGSVKYISKTDLYDRLIKCMPHKIYDNK